MKKWREWLTLCVGLAGMFAAAAQAASVHSVRSIDTRLSAARGAVSLSNSRQEGAILSATNIAPGDAVVGAVSVLNKGTGRGMLTLAATNLSNQGEAELATVLQLRIADLTSGGATVFDGSLGALHPLPLGGIGNGHRRSYRLTASLPEKAGNEYAGASVSMDFVWSASVLRSRPPCAALFRGGDHAERLTGTVGGDRILSGAGSDVARGLAGRDCIFGQRGNDRLYGGSGRDRILGGPGRDVIHCGRGFDRARIDDLDSVTGCEVVSRA